jgi:hypothetical protein
MRPLSCEEVDELLPWCVAGECEPDQRGLVEQHLAHCPRCRQGYGEAERLSTLLDWHHRESAGLERLRVRLREESRRGATRRAVLPFVRRIASVAALLFVAVGLTSWITPPPEERPEIAVGLLSGVGDFPAEVVDQVKGRPLVARGGGTRTEFLELAGRSPAEHRGKLLAAAEAGRLPAPPRVDLTLELRNRGEQTLYLDVGGAGTELRLDLSGPGALALPGASENDPPFLSRRVVRLAPGERYLLPVRYLIDGTRGHLRSLYWTEPGRYVLNVDYRVGVSPSPSERQLTRSTRTFTVPPMTIQVRRQ